MYSVMNVYEGLPPRLYRTPSEIRRDMDAISTKLCEIEGMLSVHNLLVEMIPEWSEKSPEFWIPELAELVAEAEESLRKLFMLRDALEELACEMEDVRCHLL